MQTPEPGTRSSLAAALAEVLAGAKFAYLFGSAAHDRLGTVSDVDVALDWGRVLSWEERCDLMEAIRARTGRTADLVDLRDADPIIRMQVLKTGVLIVDNDSHARQIFAIRTISEYLDFKIDRAPVEAAMLERHATGR